MSFIFAVFYWLNRQSAQIQCEEKRIEQMEKVTEFVTIFNPVCQSKQEQKTTTVIE